MNMYDYKILEIGDFIFIKELNYSTYIVLKSIEVEYKLNVIHCSECDLSILSPNDKVPKEFKCDKIVSKLTHNNIGKCGRSCYFEYLELNLFTSRYFKLNKTT